MSDEPDLEALEFRYTFAPSDDKLAFAGTNRSVRTRAGFQALALASLAAVLLASFAAASSFDGWGLIVSVSQLTAAALLIGYVIGPLLKRAVFGEGKVREFKPIEFETSVSKDGLRNANGFVIQEAKWAAVRRILLKPYGIHFDAGPTWYIPRSAFASEAEMQESYRRIKQFTQRYAKNLA